MVLLKKLWRRISASHRYEKTLHKDLYYIITIAAIIFTLSNIWLFYLETKSQQVDLVSIIGFMLLSLVGSFLFAVFVVSNRLISTFNIIKKDRQRASKLRRRIIVAFSLGAAVPTIIVAVFSTYFFNFGVQAWFDDKISKVLEQSIIVGDSYIKEHVLQLKDTAISISNDFSDLYYKLVNDPQRFQELLDAQAEIRSLDEAIIFQKDNNAILAQTSLSFSLSFLNIPSYVVDKVNKGQVVQISSDPTKIRVLIRLQGYNDTYLLIGRLVDQKIIDHINKTNGAAQEYFTLKSRISNLQIKFSMIFILLAMILLLAAIVWGRKFAERMVKPIRSLVIAAEKVKNGDFTVQVLEEGLPKDEIKILAAAFNRMIRQIERQQRDLIVAERALAWSDVARRVAHEIKNPLTPIQLSAERLLKKFKEEVKDQITFEKYANNIIKHSDEIKLIVSEFVNFARLPAPEFSKSDIISMISYLVDTRRLINDNISYQFVTNVSSFELVCDEEQINRVMVNLLQNAEEALEMVNHQKKIIVTIIIEGEFVSVLVADNGPGFSEEILENATKAYFTTKVKGTGLGLSIASRIIHEHMGELHALNLQEGGAMVKLIFNAKELKRKLK